MRAGVIGVGHLGRHHARIYNELPWTRLIGICDIDRGNGREIAEWLNVKYFKNREQLFRNIELLSIATPTPTHYEIAKEALEEGLNVLVEKPITQRVEEAEEIIEIAKRNGLVLQAAHIERFNPAILAVEGIVKDPMFIESHRIASFDSRGADVAVVLDLMVHDIDICNKFVNKKIKKIDAIGVPVLSSNFDIANARIEFENGAIANLTTSRVAQKKERKIRFFQKDAYISVNYLAHSVDVYKRSMKNGVPRIEKVDIEIIPKEPLRAEIESFVKSVRNKTSPLVTGMDGKRAIEVAYQILDVMERRKKSLLPILNS
jgi:predicted dehydrogenase